MDPTDPSEPVEAEASAPPGHLWLVLLLLRPRVFFTWFVVQPVPQLTAVACYLFGVAGALDRIDQRLMRGDKSADLFGGSFSAYWISAAVLGVVSALLFYSLGAWWYRVRLGFCGAASPDQGLARRVYAFASLVWVLPSLLYATWCTFEYPTPMDAVHGDDVGGLVVFGFILWSLWTSYTGVRTAFDVRRGRALLWFLILPGVLVAFLFSAGIVASLSGVLVAKPDLVSRKTHAGAAFVVGYPGNWRLARNHESFDPDSCVVIEPPFADCVVFLEVGPYEDVDEACAMFRGHLEENLAASGWRDEPDWHLSSAEIEQRGHAGTARVGGSPYRCGVMVRIEVLEKRGHAVWFLCAESAADKLRPGIDLVFRSLRFR